MSGSATIPGASAGARAEQRATLGCGERKTPQPGTEVATDSFLFDDPYWDEVFDSYHNRTLRTCCQS